jgi:hypothetical protein
MPLQGVVDRDASADESFAVIDESPQVELGPVQVRCRQRVQAFAQRRSSDRQCVDAVDLPRPRACRRDADINLLWTRSTRSPRSIKNRSNDPETCRQSSSAHTRSAPRPRAHRSSDADPFAPACTVCSPSSSPLVAATAAIVCERLWVSGPSTIIDLVHLHIDRVGHPGGHGLLGAMPRSYQVTPEHPRPATSDTAKASQAPEPTA